MIKYPEFEYNLNGIDEFYEDTNSRLRFWYNHIRLNALKDDGDIFEFGVFRGASLIAAALILKELGSSKTIFGFDSFSGFPSYSKFDELDNFNNSIFFSDSFNEKLKAFVKLKKHITTLDNLNPASVASSGNFSNTSYELVAKKIDYFKLDNIKIINGSFDKTVPEFFKKNNVKISSCNIDCDLYDGYKVTLPFVYKFLSTDGYINLDEYFSCKYPGAKIATDEFCKIMNISPKKNIVREGEFERWYISK